jgi:hypothetical protein
MIRPYSRTSTILDISVPFPQRLLDCHKVTLVRRVSALYLVECMTDVCNRMLPPVLSLLEKNGTVREVRGVCLYDKGRTQVGLRQNRASFQGLFQPYKSRFRPRGPYDPGVFLVLPDEFVQGDVRSRQSP